VGLSGDEQLGTATAWSTIGSGGANCGCTPAHTSTVIFDGGGVGNNNLTAAITVGSIKINSGYTGTLATANNNVTLSSSFVQNAGVFSAGSSSITVGGS